MALELSEILQEPFSYVWNNMDIYDYIEFTSYQKFRNFRERVYMKRKK